MEMGLPLQRQQQQPQEREYGPILCKGWGDRVMQLQQWALSTHSQDGGDVRPSLVGMLKATNGIDGLDGQRNPSRWVWLKLLFDPAAAA